MNKESKQCDVSTSGKDFSLKIDIEVGYFARKNKADNYSVRPVESQTPVLSLRIGTVILLLQCLSIENIYILTL